MDLVTFLSRHKYMFCIQEDTIIFSVFDQLRNQALDAETVVSVTDHVQSSKPDSHIHGGQVLFDFNPGLSDC